jgi:ATP-dependent DNA helicase DinG
MAKKIRKVFDADGLLADAIAGYTPREPQIQMAEAVAKAIDTKQSLIVEAGTGTGKTFAYLAPAFASKEKTIISTGTKNLQEQLFHRDLPVVKDAMMSPKQVALLKGRANYLCKFRMDQYGKTNRGLEKSQLMELTTVRTWAESTSSGDMGELKALPEDARILPHVTSTVDNCLGRDCPDYDGCYLVKARQAALDADIIVVNHHLFFADLALKDTGFGELIPEAQTIIFDEAHQVPDIASEYFGQQFSTRLLQDAARDIHQIYRTTLKDIEQVDKIATKLAALSADFRLAFPEKPERGKYSVITQNAEIAETLGRLSEYLTICVDILKVHIGRDKALDNIYERLVQAKTNLQAVTDTTVTGVSLWYETTPKQVVLHLTPLSIADKFSEMAQSPRRSWIFTSATLMVDGGFAHFQETMGLQSAQTMTLGSPFNYAEQALLCVPRFLPEPSHRDMQTHLLDIAKKLVKAANGRCFLLFTSHYMLRTVAASLQAEITNKVLVQGTTTKQALLDAYLADSTSVLLATGAFWEGVDVRGDDLVCVLIDTLPFAAPDDPLLQAKIDDCKKSGGNAFAKIQIPQAVITLKQGAGRLIRDEKDKGVLVICDTRLATKDYGKIFLKSLPPMQRTRDLDKAIAFLHDLAAPISSVESA